MMDPREEDDVPFDSDDDHPLIRELRNELVRLESQLDQLRAADRERAEEFAAIKFRLDELERQIADLTDRFRRRTRLSGWIAGFWGAAIGMWLSWLVRLIL